MDEAAREAARGLAGFDINLPRGWKRESAAWQAMDTGQGGWASPIPWNPANTQLPGDGAALPLPPRTTQPTTTTITYGNITIQISGEHKSPGNIARAIADEFRHMGMANNGMTLIRGPAKPPW